jgi:hypothetical protein
MKVSRWTDDDWTRWIFFVLLMLSYFAALGGFYVTSLVEAWFTDKHINMQTLYTVDGIPVRNPFGFIYKAGEWLSYGVKSLLYVYVFPVASLLLLAFTIFGRKRLARIIFALASIGCFFGAKHLLS